MVRFSCFHTHIHSHKSKKTIQQSSKTIHKTFQDCPQDPALNVSSIPTSLDPFLFKAHDNNPFNTSAEKVTSSPSVENCWKSEEMDSSFSPEGNVEVHQTGRLKKCQSLGSGLDKEEFVSSGIDTEYEIDKGFSCDDSHEKNYSGTFDALDHSGLVEQFDSKDPGTILLNQYPEVMVSESFQVNFDLEHSETIFSIGDSKQLPGEAHGDFVTHLSDEHANDAGHHPPGTPPMIAKSCSLPNMEACITSEEESPYHEYIVPHCISSEDLDAQDVKKKEFLNHDIESHAMADQERDNSIFESDKDKCENSFGNEYDSYNLAGSANDWTIPGTYGVDKLKSLQGESSTYRWDELPSKEFKIKRIEEWVSSIDLEDSSPFQEINESCYPTEVKKVSNTLGGVTTARLDSKTIPGVEVAKAYISSLTATSTSAQLTNLGLVAIPFLSAFVNLKILNLSGNAIVRMTAGALPRGLHMLNLSKNNISTIEGLRELTRLRVLDLSYNRIFKIGHGLASCSSLKELYLAGNKINEVEGLHRLLKLSILDLRFNKISTATCLGQLAANYSSLQAINLEGNPAQRNVGDEQLKKYLQGLLPHLVYFNKQPIKASSSKEVTDRSTRSAITAHQFDRSLRSENKITKRGSRGVATQKTSSSNHGRLSQAVISSKQLKGRHGHLLPSRAKETNHPLDLGRKLLGLESNLSLKRSQSEGTLGPS